MKTQANIYKIIKFWKLADNKGYLILLVSNERKQKIIKNYI